jgi:DNA transformation protein and related proteins
MPVSDEFIAYVVDQLSGWGEVSVRKMFGGAGLYREGAIFGVIADGVA